MQELHIGEQIVLQMRFNSNGIMGNRITNGQEIMKKLHNKGYQLCFANGDSRKKRMLRQVFAFGIRYQYFTDLRDYLAEKKTEMAFS